MVLWVLTVMMVIVMSFSLMTRTEAHSTLSFKEGMEKKFLAEAGIERALAELFYMRQNHNAIVASQGMEAWKADGTPYGGNIGNGSYAVSVTGETGKIDINRVPDIILKNLLLNSGVKDKDADIIVDSIMDWKDADDLHRLNGAESDYYMSLPNPYKAKNADFNAIEELLLVRGVTTALLYGSADKKGIMEFITVNSNSNVINVNYAPREVLLAIPGIDSESADRIIQSRQEKNISNIQEILGDKYQIASPYLSAGDTNVFTIEAVGYNGNAKSGYPVKATVIIESNNKYRYVYYKSPAYMKQ